MLLRDAGIFPLRISSVGGDVPASACRRGVDGTCFGGVVGRCDPLDEAGSLDSGDSFPFVNGTGAVVLLPVVISSFASRAAVTQDASSWATLPLSLALCGSEFLSSRPLAGSDGRLRTSSLASSCLAKRVFRRTLPCGSWVSEQFSALLLALTELGGLKGPSALGLRFLRFRGLFVCSSIVDRSRGSLIASCGRSSVPAYSRIVAASDLAGSRAF